jgi:hypothetical protein
VEGYTVTVIVPQAKEPFIPSAVADIHYQSGKGDRERGHASERVDRFKQHQTGESGANVTRRRGEQATLDQAWNEGSGPEFPYGDIASPHPPDWGRDLHLCRFNFSTRMALPTSRMG